MSSEECVLDREVVCDLDGLYLIRWLHLNLLLDTVLALHDPCVAFATIKLPFRPSYHSLAPSCTPVITSRYAHGCQPPL
jgi:hypothetical protein